METDIENTNITGKNNEMFENQETLSADNKETLEVLGSEEAAKDEPAKPKKRGRKPGTHRKGYFYEDEEDAFKKYVESDDVNERDRIFNDKLHPAFTKMIESLIRRYNLFTPNEEFEDTFNDTMSFLITKVNNFDFSRGKKVYSYCGTICKNYLILKRMQVAKNTSKTISYESVFDETNPDERESDDGTNDVISFNTNLIKTISKKISEILDKQDEYNLTENEVKVGSAIVVMLDNWEDIFQMTDTKKFNRTSVLFFIREYTMLSTKEVREAIKVYKDLYAITKEELLSK